MTILRRALQRRYQSWPWPEPGPGQPLIPPYGGHLTAAGVPVTEQGALAQSTVFACVGLVSDAVATLPLDAFRQLVGLDRTRQPVEPAPPLVGRPHPEMERNEWVGRMMMSLLLRGNAYGRVIATDRLGYPTAILPVHPDETTVTRDDGSLVYRFAGRLATPAFPAGEAVHVRGMTLAGQDQGLAPVAYARQSIGLALAAERFGASLFGSGANPSGVLGVPQTLTRAQAEEIKDDWERAHSGFSRRPAVLSGGITWTPVSLTPEDSQFLETRQWTTEEICRWFRVDPALVGEKTRQSSWAASVEAVGIQFVTYTLRPWIIRLEAALSSLLPRGQFVKFNVSGLLRGDTQTRYSAYATARQWGWMSVNEIRALEDLPPIAKGDSYLVPLNMGALGGAGVPMAEVGGEEEEEEGESEAEAAALERIAAEVRQAEELERLRKELVEARVSRRLTVLRDEWGRAATIEVDGHGAR